MLKRYLTYVSKTPVLWTSFIIMNLITFGVFRHLPELPGLVIDMQQSYSHAQLLALLGELSERGRQSYLIANMVDMVYPLFYGSFFAGLLYRLRLREGLWLLATLPLLLGLVDLAENVQIRAMLLAYPDIPVALVDRASLTTSIKQGLVALMLGLTLVTLLFAAVRKLRGRSET